MRFFQPATASTSPLSMSFKLFGLKGSKTLTHDFVGEPIDGVGDPMSWAKAAASPQKDLPEFASIFGFEHLTEVDALLATTATSPKEADASSASYHRLDVGGRLPVSWGWGRGLRWWASGPKVPTECSGTSCLSEETVQGDLIKFMKANRNGLKIDFYGQLQGCEDTIENANKTWKSKEIAKLGSFVLHHEVDMRVCDHVAFDPWQAHKDHKPLGSIHRGLKLIYSDDRKVRKAAECTHSFENCQMRVFFLDHPDILPK